MFRLFARDSFFVASFVWLAACTGAENRTLDPTPAPTNAPSALQAAHEAYLSGDSTAMGERIRDVLLDPTSGELAKENAFELLDKAYDAQKGALPSRSVLPAGFENMKLGVMHGQGPNAPYGTIYLYVQAVEGTGAHVTEMSVRRLPGEVLLDLRSARGKLAIRRNRPGFEDLVLEVTGVESPPADGVYAIRIAVDDGRLFDGWVIARGMASTATPEVLSPTPSISFSDPNPELRWTPFTSPQYAPFEQRTLSVYVHDEGNHKAAWDYWLASPGSLSTVRVGNHPAAPKTTLSPGSYWFSLTASEERKFGPVRLARSSQTGVPFNVVK